VNDALKAAGFEPHIADIERVPSVEATPTDASQIGMLRKMIEALEDDDDVQKVETNCSIDLYEA
jgi:transcriptional/translational regulatory protein YebC/TACO1